MKTRLLLAAALLVAAGGLARSQDKALERGELDKRVVTAVYESAVAGTEIFNKGKHEECLRLYQGTLLAVVPLLDHKPKLQATVKQRLKRAEGMKVLLIPNDANLKDGSPKGVSVRRRAAPGRGARAGTKRPFYGVLGIRRPFYRVKCLTG